MFHPECRRLSHRYRNDFRLARWHQPPIRLRLLRLHDAAVVVEKSLRVVIVPHVDHELGRVAVLGEVVGGVGVAEGVLRPRLPLHLLRSLLDGFRAGLSEACLSSGCFVKLPAITGPDFSLSFGARFQLGKEIGRKGNVTFSPALCDIEAHKDRVLVEIDLGPVETIVIRRPLDFCFLRPSSMKFARHLYPLGCPTTFFTVTSEPSAISTYANRHEN